jgi:hypothetical protein
MQTQEPLLKLGTPISVGQWQGTVEAFDRESVTVVIHPGRRVRFDRRLVEDAVEESRHES